MMDYIRSHGQSWGVKIVFLIIIVVFVFWGVGSFRTTPHGTAVMVDDEPVVTAMLESEYRQARDNMRQERGDAALSEEEDLNLRYQILANTVNNILLFKEADRVGITVTPAEVRQVIVSMEGLHNSAGVFDKALYEEAMRQRRTTPAAFEDLVRKDLLLGKMRMAITGSAAISDAEARTLFDYAYERRTLEYALFNAADYMDKITVQPEQLEAAYNAYQELWREPASISLNFVRLTADELAATIAPTEEAIASYYAANGQIVFSRPAQVKLQQILVISPKNAQPVTEAQALDKVNKAEAALAAGKSFAEVAAEYSDDISTAKQGGELGWLSREQLIEPLDTAFTMKPGEVSKPLRSGMGYHIIRVEAREESRVLPLDEVRADISRALARDEAASLLPGLATDAQGLINAGKSMEEIASGLNLPLHKTGLVTAEAANEHLKVDDRDMDMLFALPAGTLLNYPLESQDGFVIVQVAEANSARVKPLDQVSEEVKTLVIYEQSLKLAEEDARKARETFTGSTAPEDFAGKLTTGPEFTRNTLDSGPGFSLELVQAAFAEKAAGDWMYGVYPTQSGAAIVRVASIRPPTESEWQKEKPGFTMQALTSRRQEMMTLFLVELHSRAEIREYDMTFVNPKGQ